MTLTNSFSFDEVRQVLGGVLGADLHAKRVDSLCDASLGVCTVVRSPSPPSATDWPPRVAH
jgi:hypothetical protein